MSKFLSINYIDSPKVTPSCIPCSEIIRRKTITKDVLAEDIEDHPQKDEIQEITVRFACPVCNLLFTRSTAVTRHVRVKHKE